MDATDVSADDARLSGCALLQPAYRRWARLLRRISERKIKAGASADRQDIT